MRIIFKAILPPLLRARLCCPVPYYNIKRIHFENSKMAKRKRSSIAAGEKETLQQPTVQIPTANPSESVVDELDSAAKEPKKKRAKPDVKAKPRVPDVKVKEGIEGLGDPEAEGEELADEEELKEALSRPPPVNSDYLPLPWKGRLGYVRCDPVRLSKNVLT
jgi:hypothetical protein